MQRLHPHENLKTPCAGIVTAPGSFRVDTHKQFISAAMHTRQTQLPIQSSAAMFCQSCLWHGSRFKSSSAHLGLKLSLSSFYCRSHQDQQSIGYGAASEGTGPNLETPHAGRSWSLKKVRRSPRRHEQDHSPQGPGETND